MRGVKIVFLVAVFRQRLPPFDTLSLLPPRTRKLRLLEPMVLRGNCAGEYAGTRRVGMEVGGIIQRKPARVILVGFFLCQRALPGSYSSCIVTQLDIEQLHC